MASANVRLRKKRIGSIGAGAAAPTRRTHDERDADGERADDLGRAPAERVAADEAPDDPEAARSWRARAPAGRASRSGPRSRRAGCSASGTSTRPIGTLSQKIQCHEMPWTTAPPTSGPNATARPLMPPHAPSARPRRSAGTPAERIVSVSGITIAPPTPCTARATSSIVDRRSRARPRRGEVKIAEPDARTCGGGRSGRRARHRSAAARRRSACTR